MRTSIQKISGDHQDTGISSNEEEKDEPITWGFYVSMGLGFIVGFWGSLWQPDLHQAMEILVPPVLECLG